MRLASLLLIRVFVNVSPRPVARIWQEDVFRNSTNVQASIPVLATVLRSNRVRSQDVKRREARSRKAIADVIIKMELTADDSSLTIETVPNSAR